MAHLPVTARTRSPRMDDAQSPTGTAPAAAPDPATILRSPGDVGLVVLGALVGVPVAAIAYFFLAFVSKSQHWTFDSLPEGLGFDSAPMWWPLLPLVAS